MIKADIFYIIAVVLVLQAILGVSLAFIIIYCNFIENKIASKKVLLTLCVVEYISSILLFLLRASIDVFYVTDILCIIIWLVNVIVAAIKLRKMLAKRQNDNKEDSKDDEN